MLKFLNLFTISLAARSDCSGSPCGSCLSGYLYSYTCLPICPTGYIQTASPNLCTSSGSLNLFDLNF